MRLKAFETYGFKSFAERTEINFEEGITATLGQLEKILEAD